MYHKAIDYVENQTKYQYKSQIRKILSVDDNDRQMFKDKDEKLKRQAAIHGVYIDLTQSDEISEGKGWDLDK